MLFRSDFIQIDTTNILFICGGAFDGLEKIIEKRIGNTSMGFGAELKSKDKKNIGDTFRLALPQDLVKFGLIPEFVGRIPINVALDNLDEDTLVRILVEPKNSIIKQYKKLLELDGVELEVEDDAVRQIAKLSLERKTGARGLRAILESIMLNVMYEVPSDETIKKITVTKESVLKKEEPKIERRTEKVTTRRPQRKQIKSDNENATIA